ncbi:MAG: hypothetical protein SPJ97_00555, partial [Bacteroides sp.]|nr:hypothetical protein [Bacteroides sp.]
LRKPASKTRINLSIAHSPRSESGCKSRYYKTNNQTITQEKLEKNRGRQNKMLNKSRLTSEVFSSPQKGGKGRKSPRGQKVEAGAQGAGGFGQGEKEG